MTGKEKEYGVTAESPIVLYYYDELTDTDWFCKLLKQRFRALGHMREIKFVKWDCYKELPGRDGDLFIFDAVTMSALVDKGFLHQLPDIIDVDDMFTWTIEKSKVRQKTYGVPLMVCSNALICRREDDRKIRSIMDLHEPVAIPLRSMMMYYYLQELCQARHRKSGMPVCFGIPPLLEVGHGISDGSRHPFDIIFNVRLI